MHFTLKTNPLKFDDLKDFIACYNSENKSKRKESERFHSFLYDKLMERGKGEQFFDLSNPGEMKFEKNPFHIY